MPPVEQAPSLASAQDEFAAGLLWRAEDVPRGLIGRDTAAPVKRFNVYRNTVFASLIGVLRGRFPVVARLVGEPFFKAAAHHFVAEHPPRSPALIEYGGELPDFLAAFEPAQGLPYLPDVARLEWLCHAAYNAADAEPMDPARLAGIPPETIGEIVLQLHPSVHVLTSPYPIVSIWETNSLDEDVRRIGPEVGAEAALILRPGLDVIVMRLGGGGDAFLGALARGASLAEAAGRGLDLAPEFSLAEALGALLAAGAFTGYFIGTTTPTEGETS